MRAAVDNPRGRARAARNAGRLEALERRLGVHVEPELQALLLDRPRLLRALSAGYVLPNVMFTVGSVLRLFLRRHPDYHRIRTAGLFSIAAPAAVFYLFPCDPPRKLDHMVDTIRDGGLDLESGPVVMLYNPIAAFPSLHMAFAVVTSAAVLADSRSPAVRAAALAYPGAVAFVVFTTANHFVLDAVAGAALGLLGLGLRR
ncbi:MAG: phosphatase PAP2 family protein [Thermoleophilia bacterium]|nr:phosphatase PAP2 family protein [Thermoleophilia bacterium]